MFVVEQGCAEPLRSEGEGNSCHYQHGSESRAKKLLSPMTEARVCLNLLCKRSKFYCFVFEEAQMSVVTESHQEAVMLIEGSHLQPELT